LQWLEGKKEGGACACFAGKAVRALKRSRVLGGRRALKEGRTISYRNAREKTGGGGTAPLAL